MEKQTMGSFIAALRRAAGMTQREMAERLNVSDKAVSRWERDESAPDLSLLPLIADLFGITIDELVRGRRSAETKREEVPGGEETVRSDERVRRGVQTIAGRELAKLRNRSLISTGIGAAGMVVAFLCNFCFTAARLGFFLSLLFYGAAALLETVFIQNYFTSIGSRMAYIDLSCDGTAIDAYLSPYRERGVRSALAVYALIMGLLGTTLPLVFAPAYTGLLLNWSQIIGCLLLGAVLAGVVLLIYRFAIRPALTNKGILPELPAPTERDLARRRIVKRYALILAILLAVTGIGAAIFNSIGVSTYAKAKVFHDYDSFVKYMEEEQYREQGFSDEYIAEIMDEEYTYPDYEILYDEEGNELCRYSHNYRSSVVQIKQSFEKSKDGLPICVYTDRAIGAAYDLQQAVNVILFLLALVETAVCGFLCYRKCRNV